MQILTNLMGIYYIEHFNLTGDAKILRQTIEKIITRVTISKGSNLQKSLSYVFYQLMVY